MINYDSGRERENKKEKKEKRKLAANTRRLMWTSKTEKSIFLFVKAEWRPAKEDSAWFDLGANEFTDFKEQFDLLARWNVMVL